MLTGRRPRHPTRWPRRLVFLLLILLPLAALWRAWHLLRLRVLPAGPVAYHAAAAHTLH